MFSRIRHRHYCDCEAETELKWNPFKAKIKNRLWTSPKWPDLSTLETQRRNGFPYSVGTWQPSNYLKLETFWTDLLNRENFRNCFCVNTTQRIEVYITKCNLFSKAHESVLWNPSNYDMIHAFHFNPCNPSMMQQLGNTFARARVLASNHYQTRKKVIFS